MTITWSQLIKTIFKGKRKVSHLINDASGERDDLFKSGHEEGSMIMTWLWNLLFSYIYLLFKNLYLFYSKCPIFAPIFQQKSFSI